MTYTHNPNGVCFDIDHNSNGTQPINVREDCKGCKHLNIDNNPEIGYEVCCGEYCNYKYKPIPATERNACINYDPECEACIEKDCDECPLNEGINQSLTLSFGLPGLNEMINVARTNRYASAKQKKKYTKKVEKELIAQHCIPETPMTSISINCIWTESGRARDPDNIRVGIKYILDAMVNTGVLKDDSMKHVKFIGDTFQKGNKRTVQVNWSD